MGRLSTFSFRLVPENAVVRGGEKIGLPLGYPMSILSMGPISGA